MARSTSTTTAPTWREILAKSEVERKRADNSKAKASALLWQGTVEAIDEWLPKSKDDAQAENLYNEVMAALGGDHRKGDASKVASVARAVKNNGLVLGDYDNLSQAYAEAVRRTKTAKQNEAEDEAAEAAIEALEVPATTRTVDGAAAILLSKGIDGAVVAILDALGSENEAAHRAFLRAVSTEISARVTAKAQNEKAEKDAQRKAEADAKRAEREAEQAKKKAEREAEQAKKKAEREAAAAEKKATAAKALAERKANAVKPKAAPAKKAPVKAAGQKAKPKGAPVRKATPVKAEPEPVVEEDNDDMFAEIENEDAPKVQTNLDEIKARKGAPVKRPARV